MGPAPWVRLARVAPRAGKAVRSARRTRRRNDRLAARTRRRSGRKSPSAPPAWAVVRAEVSRRSHHKNDRRLRRVFHTGRIVGVSSWSLPSLSREWRLAADQGPPLSAGGQRVIRCGAGARVAASAFVNLAELRDTEQSSPIVRLKELGCAAGNEMKKQERAE